MRCRVGGAAVDAWTYVASASTLAERQLDFADAGPLLAGTTLTLEDDRSDYPEPRFQTHGRLDGRVVLVMWTPTDDGIRAISMRNCHDKEAAALPFVWDDPHACDEDTPEWTEDQLDRAELAVGGKVVRAANGTLARAGRPPLGAAAKRQVTLRLDPDVIDRFREGGPG